MPMRNSLLRRLHRLQGASPNLSHTDLLRRSRRYQWMTNLVGLTKNRKQVNLWMHRSGANPRKIDGANG